MITSDMIKGLCVKMNISISELSRRMSSLLHWLMEIKLK